MPMKLSGMGTLRRQFDSLRKVKEKEIVVLRRKIAEDLVLALVENIPVWSGRTVRSIQVSNSGGGNARESHPDRHDYSADGEWKNHKRDFGDTAHMALGQEPMRSSAEAVARASAAGADYGLDAKVFVVSTAYNWDVIDRADYKTSRNSADQVPRNNPVVSRIAIEQIRSKYGRSVK